MTEWMVSCIGVYVFPYAFLSVYAFLRKSVTEKPLVLLPTSFS